MPRPREEKEVPVMLKGAVRYDGTAFAGWQVQPDQRTIQAEIEGALSTILGESVRIHGASRTDAGVHAFGQVFSFEWPDAQPWDRLQRSLSSMLGPEIRLDRVEPAPPGFHARKSARSKRYAYAIDLARHADPLSARYAWCVPWALDLELLARLCSLLEGEHDFAGFQGSGASVRTTVRTLSSVRLQRGGVIGPLDADTLWRVEFDGNGFLYHMVRNIMGTVVDIARGHRPEALLEDQLAAPGPFRGRSAPAHGLTLVGVTY